MYSVGNADGRKVSKIRSMLRSSGHLSQWARSKVYQFGLILLATIGATYFIWTLTSPPPQKRSIEHIPLSKTILLRKLESPQRIRKGFVPSGDDFISGPSPHYANYFDEFSFVERDPESLNQKDGRLIRYVRARWVLGPFQQPFYNFYDKKKTKEDVPTQLSQWARSFFKDKRGGVFVEVGAGDGGIGSHTLELEMTLGWTGLLVECNPSVGPFLRSTHRKAFTASVCVSKSSKYKVMNLSFHEWGLGQIKDEDAVELRPPQNETSEPPISLYVETVPLFTLLAGADLKQVDFLVMELSDSRALDEYPFPLLPIKVIVVKKGQRGRPLQEGELIRRMVSKEYILKKTFDQGHLLFLRKDLDAWSLFP